MSDVERKIREMIAARANISPDDVTADYIEERRRVRIYAKGAFSIKSRYGGYHIERLRILSADQIEENRKKADAFLLQFKDCNLD
jgi:hypothetical protein